jgi:hypothetical protein
MPGPSIVKLCPVGPLLLTWNVYVPSERSAAADVDRESFSVTSTGVPAGTALLLPPAGVEVELDEPLPQWLQRDHYRQGGDRKDAVMSVKFHGGALRGVRPIGFTIRPVKPPEPSVWLFDFDGTLVDSERLILASFRHATGTVLGATPSDDVLRAGIG